MAAGPIAERNQGNVRIFFLSQKALPFGLPMPSIYDITGYISATLFVNSCYDAYLLIDYHSINYRSKNAWSFYGPLIMIC